MWQLISSHIFSLIRFLNLLFFKRKCAGVMQIDVQQLLNYGLIATYKCISSFQNVEMR